MSRKLKRKPSSRNRDSSARQPIRAQDLQPGNIVWLPLSAMEKSQLIRRFEYNHKVPSADNDQVLPPEAYNHPMVVLGIMNLPSRHSNRDDYAIVANLTSFGNTTGCEDTGRLHTRGATVRDSCLAIFPSEHPSNKDVLYLQKGKLDKCSYVQLVRIYVPISVLKTYTKGPTATPLDIHLTSPSLDILLGELGIKAPQSGGRGPGVGRATTAIPPSPSLPVLSTQARLLIPRSMPYHPPIVVPKDILGESEAPGPSHRGATVMPSSLSLAMRTFQDTVSAPHSIPSRPPISAREDTLLITTNTQRLSQPIPLPSYTRVNYGSIETWSLPPPITWNPRGRTTKISGISNSIGRERVLRCLKVALCLSILALVSFYIPWATIGSIFTKIGHSLTSIWASIGSIFTKIGHSLTSTWSSCWGFVANGWSSFISLFRNSWHNFIAWLKSLAWK